MRSIFRLAPIGLALASLLLVPTLAMAQVQQPPPVIERLEPTSGPPGTTVQMVGRYFRPDQQVRLAGRAVEVISRLPNRWTIRVPAGATSGHLAIEVPGVATTIGPEFRVLAAAPPPAITDVQPRIAAPGAEVRIVGENFSPRITENVVTFNGQAVVVRSATPTQLVVIVPQGAQNGRFAVRVSGTGEATAAVDLQIGTGIQITGFTPAIGAPGSEVTLTVTGLAERASSNRMFLGNVPCRVLRVTDGTVVLQVPPRGTTGLFMIDVRGLGRAFATQPFVVQAAPVVASFDPPAGPPGTQVRIRGQSFGTDVRQVQVLFGTAAGRVRGLTESEIIAEVPAGATTGPIAVTVHGIGPALSRAAFTAMVPPVVQRFAPRSGGPGTEVVITGTGFAATPAQNRVTLSGTPCQVLSAAPTQLRVRIPQAASGPLTVDIEHAGQARSSDAFVVTNPPVVARFEPERSTAGSVVTIHGTSFGTNPALVEAAIGDRRMELRSVTNERIEAVIPQGATSGRIRVTVRLQGSSLSEREHVVIGEFTVAAVEPATAHPGQAIAIRGLGFAREGMQVRFAGVSDAMPYAFTSPSEIRLYVPMGAQSGPVTVRSADGRETTVAFTAGAPPSPLGITAIDPDCLRVRCRAVVHGYG
ncbi:MAG: IPT/TIG domain-containing protein, partial [Myxococcota bacterium]|nr:IPT/TIG domain-containing protein [Myxococcota bacterium]